MPSLTTWAPFCAVFCPCGQCYPRDQNNHMAAPVKVARQQTTPELSGTFRTLPPEPTPTRAGTLQNPPEPSKTFRNQPFGTFRNLYLLNLYLLNLRQHTPEPSEIFRNLPPEPTPFYTGTLRNLPEPASGTYTPAHAGTLRNLPEPSSGTCSCDPHRHTPELIWAEDPISLRCWGKKCFLSKWLGIALVSSRSFRLTLFLSNRVLYCPEIIIPLNDIANFTCRGRLKTQWSVDFRTWVWYGVTVWTVNIVYNSNNVMIWLYHFMICVSQNSG